MILTFDNSKRVTIDGNLVTSIPKGFHYARDGFGGNQHWLYIVPEDYSLTELSLPHLMIIKSKRKS